MRLESVLKAQKEFPEFTAEVESLSTEEINARLAQFAKDSVENDNAKANDSDLETARATVNEYAAPYREAKKAIKVKSDYLVSLLNGRGAS